ncbi:MAG: methionyl-tRNA formyltransferase [Planctomycetota bacterium]
MRVAFFGSGPFAVPALRALAASAHELVRIVTQPARPAGRGGKLRPTPVARTAEELGCEAVECADVNAAEAVADVAGLSADVICVADFGQMIREPIRRAARRGAFNMHGSVLPELRGAAPVNWAIIRGYARTGVTTFDLVDAMDAGDIYLIKETDIQPQERADELTARLADLGAQAVCETLAGLAAGTLTAALQDHSKKTLAPKLTKADGLIDWQAGATSIRNLIHGTWPWPGGQAVLHRKAGKDMDVTVARAEVVDESQGRPGVFDDDLLVGTGKGRLRILQVKPAGKRLMDWADFVNGCRVAAGDRFSRPEGNRDDS